jgi:hypothetical protein
VGPAVDWRSVGAGTVLALAVALPVVGAVAVVDAIVGIGCRSNAGFLPYLLVLGGMVAGGRRAGRRRPDAPLTHGALAAVGAYAVVATLTTVERLLRSSSSHCPRSSAALVFNGLMSASAGVAGGFLAWRGQSRAGAEERRP